MCVPDVGQKKSCSAMPKSVLITLLRSGDKYMIAFAEYTAELTRRQVLIMEGDRGTERNREERDTEESMSRIFMSRFGATASVENASTSAPSPSRPTNATKELLIIASHRPVELCKA